MPELPEVETVVRGLQKSVLGRKILSVWIGKSDFIDNPAEFTRLSGQKIAAIERFGKFMLLRLADGEELAAGGGGPRLASSRLPNRQRARRASRIRHPCSCISE